MLATETPADTATAMGAAQAPGACDPEFEELYQTYFPLLRRIAIRKFQIPMGDVDELVQDVFATYLTHIARVRAIRPYLIGGICNAARQYWREAEAARNVFCDTDSEPASRDDAMLDAIIRNSLMSAALARLGPSCRETLRRFYLDGESAIDIASSRATTQNSILQILSYCRRRVRAAYREMRGDS
ncbi:MAG TPA: sigma-70 family RNA polymerase sigma factor [Sphingomicrobium sp.]|nr:sigma-70 family RNA polymerase sigma factor [Sphingomicrobium sp.]